MTVWNHANQGRQSLTPDNHLARFIGRNYLPLPSWDVHVLDIGPGKHGANQTYLQGLGFKVLSIDISEEARANIHEDICTPDLDQQLTDRFDIVIDVNTLCHVEGMDYSRFPKWLKSKGRMFSIMPRYDTWRGHLEGKGFVLCPTREALDHLFGENFSRVDYDHATYTYQGNLYSSWLIEATK